MKKLKYRQRWAIRLLLDGLTTTQVAKRLGVDEKKIWKWFGQAPLAERVAGFEVEREACFDRRLLALLEQVVLTLNRMLKSRNLRTVMFAVSAILELNERLPQIREHFGNQRRLRDGPPQFVEPTAWRGPRSN